MTGVFPSALKTAKVVPVCKKYSKLYYSDYRPISLLSNIEKMLEKVRYKRLYTFLKKNVIYNLQIGFKQQCSTSHASINVTENIGKALDYENISRGVFVDLQKGFDAVDHKILLAKLNQYGIREFQMIGLNPICLIAISSYFSIRGYASGLAALNRGVPQGSVPGPLIFLLYINDLNQAIKF